MAFNTSELAAGLAEKSPDEIASILRSLQDQADTNAQKKHGKFCRKTNMRMLLVILQAGFSLENYEAKHTHGQKGRCEQAILARSLLQDR